MSVSSMEELLVEELKDIYSAEKQITRALPKMAKGAASDELRQAFQTHLEETQGQLERLDKIFETLGKSSRGKTCHGMQGVLEEGSEVLEEMEKGSLRDAALISAAQRVEHYEMAGYGSVAEFARVLGKDEIVQLLEETLAEEKATDEKLTTLAQTVNSEAHSEDDEEESEDEEDEEDDEEEDLDEEEEDPAGEEEDSEEEESEEEEPEEEEPVPAKGKAKPAAKKSKSPAKSKSKSRAA